MPPRSAVALVTAALAAGLAPDPIGTVAAWAEEVRVVAAESSPYPGRWRTDLVPYLAEIMECLSLSHSSREVIFKKSAQVAGTEAGINLFGFVAARSPAPMLIVLPTGDEVRKYVRLKLQPAIDVTPELRRRVREQKNRDEKGSTTTHKSFPGGWCQITGANSSAGLQMVSVRVLILEEVSEYPFDVDGRGDPVDLALKRTTAFSRNRKVFYCSTPGLKGMCRISAKYEASDQRHYFVPCPQCGEMQTLRFEQMRYRPEPPHQVHYVCSGSGCVIEEKHRRAMLAGGEWRAQAPGPERAPGFWINQLYSPFVSWADTVAEHLAAQGDPQREKVFVQQVLGQEYEQKGDAPDWLKLAARREDYPLGRIPPGGLIITAAVDVQADRLEWAVWAWGAAKTSWLIDFGVLEGDTSAEPVWARLTPVLERQYEGPTGRVWPIECAAIDAGYQTQAVYAYVRARGPRVIAVKGMPSHLAPALGTPTRQEVTWPGKRGGVMLWPVGVWSLKAEFYANLRKTIAGPDADGQFAGGTVHLPRDADERYLKQLTAEYLLARERRGFLIQDWVLARGQRNEALDIRVYAAAAAAHLGIDRVTPAGWIKIAAERGQPLAVAQGDLGRLWAPTLDQPSFAKAPEGKPPAAVARARPARPFVHGWRH